MTDSEQVSEIAETLFVLVGESAWAAARAFGAEEAKAGKPAQARYWRNVARAVLRRLSGGFASPVELTIKPDVSAEALPMAEWPLLAPAAPPAPAADPATSIESMVLAGPPIPLRALRQLALLPKPRDEAEAAEVTQAEIGAIDLAKAA